MRPLDRDAQWVRIDRFLRALNKRRQLIATGRVPNRRDRINDLECVRAALAAAQQSTTIAPELS